MEDVDKALDVLEDALSPPDAQKAEVALPQLPPTADSPSAPVVNDAPPAGPSPPQRPTTVPPPLRRRAKRRATVGRVQQRTKFEGLFNLDPTPGLGVPGTLEEKLAHLRERMRAMEAQLAAVRQAWDTREREMDALEQLMLHERQRAEQNQAKVQEILESKARLQAFIQEKKAELEDYHHNAQKVFEQQRQQEIALRDELARATQDTAQTRDTLQAELKRLQQELQREAAQRRQLQSALSAREQDLAGKEEQLQALNAALESSTSQAARTAATQDEVRTRDEAIFKLRRALDTTERHVEALRRKLAENSAGGLEERCRSLEQDLAAAGEAYEHLRSLLTASKKAAAQSEQALLVAQRELAELRLQRAAPAQDPATVVRLGRTLTICADLVDELGQVVEEIAADLFDATGVTSEATEDANRLTMQLHKALGIAQRLVGQ